VKDSLTVVLVGVFGLMALVAIVVLSFYNHVVPNEVSSLPAVALGILGGLALPRKNNDPA
jgi:hypothetical protein